MPRQARGKAAQAFPVLLGLSGLLIAAGLAGLAADLGQWGLYCAAAGLAAAATLLWLRHAALDAHDRNLERLIGGIEAAVRSTNPYLPPLRHEELDARLQRLLSAASALVARLATPAATEARLAAILGALPQPLIVIGPQALVTLANQPARELLGAGQLQAGTSIFDAIDHASLGEILPLLREDGVLETTLRLTSGERCEARLRALPEHGGAVIALQGRTSGATGLVHALDLHDAIPPRTAPRAETPLSELSVVVLDCETTGLNVALDRIVSLAAVRVQGTRIVAGETLDLLVNPGQPIPPAATAIHGITDAMVFEQPSLALQWPHIEAALRDCVVVGHNIGFDLALLEIELRRAGIRWRRPPSLCTLQLAAALEPQLQDLNLEVLARTYGIAGGGRHTALGDALLTAELYLHLLALMQARGDRTFADAQARAATARRVIRQQEAAGW
jgi:DNA polymerase-3 subunit epsilon